MLLSSIPSSSHLSATLEFLFPSVFVIRPKGVEFHFIEDFLLQVFLLSARPKKIHQIGRVVKRMDFGDYKLRSETLYWILHTTTHRLIPFQSCCLEAFYRSGHLRAMCIRDETGSAPSRTRVYYSVQYSGWGCN